MQNLVCWDFTKIADFSNRFVAKLLRLRRCKKCAHLVELEKCCQTHMFLQIFVLIQPKTSEILPKIQNLPKTDNSGSVRAGGARSASQRQRTPGSDLGMTSVHAWRENKRSQLAARDPYFLCIRFGKFHRQVCCFTELRGCCRKTSRTAYLEYWAKDKEKCWRLKAPLEEYASRIIASISGQTTGSERKCLTIVLHRKEILYYDNFSIPITYE